MAEQPDQPIEPDSALRDDAVERAERIAFLSLASDLARGRDVLVVDDGASALAGVAAHLDSLALTELATAAEGAYDLVVADITEPAQDAAEQLQQLQRVARAETGIALVRAPNSPEFQPLLAAAAQGFAGQRMLRQHNWVASALFDDAAFAWDNPSNAAAASLRKLAGARAGEELYTIVLAGHGELPAAVPHLAVTRSAVLRDLIDELQAERDRAAAELTELRAANANQAERIRELDEQLAWFDENGLNVRNAVEKRPWAKSLLGLWTRMLSLAVRVRQVLNS